jgi:hypothetical protein
VQPRSRLAAAAVQSGSMPPTWSGGLDGRLTLSDAERAELVRGLSASIR